MITLSFSTTHLSITSLPTAVLPDFVLITGPNGAGKSHLLRAIEQGAVSTDATAGHSPNNPSQIRYFDWASMVPQDTGYFASENIRNERLNLYQHFVNLQNQPSWLEPTRVIARNAQLPPQYISDPARLLILSDEEKGTLFPDGDAAGTLGQVAETLTTLQDQILTNMDVNMRAQLRAAAAFAKRPIMALSEKDILSPAVPTWGQNDLFQQSFARLFVAYRDLKLANTIARFRASEGQDAVFLTDEEFVELHGPAPWDFVNSSLTSAGLDFFINQPTPDDYTQFQPLLTKRTSGINVPFSALSSGEKVLMSFAFCVYYSNDKRQISVQPKLLLLDEIDAPLHPSMSRNVIETITRTLVGTFGIKVIATTHSPSTIALAPEESIYAMQPGVPGLHKKDKAAALNILTVGVPTIAISYDGRRQVFVESPRDAKAYEGIYRLLKAKIDSERSLEFVATGTRSAQKQETNTGCEVVKRLVSDLSSAGNISVFGLLDWDGVHSPDQRMAVLAHGSRDGLENVFLDPLPLGIAMFRNLPSLGGALGLPSGMSYIELVNSEAAVFQAMVTKICEMLFGSPPQQVSTATYVGGLALDMDSRFFTTDDHALEAMILQAFPQVAAISKNQDGKLIEYVIANVFLDCPQFIPSDLKSVIVDLLERPSH